MKIALFLALILFSGFAYAGPQDEAIAYKDASGEVKLIMPVKEIFDPNSATRKNLAAQGVTFKDDDEVMRYIIDKDVKGDRYIIINKKDLPKSRAERLTWNPLK